MSNILTTFTFPFFLALVLLSFHPQYSQVSATNPYTVTDLDQSGSQFICQALVWTASNLKSGLIYSTCGTGVYILGGYNILGTSLFGASNGDYYQRIYSSLPTHNLIQYSFSLYALDSWSSSIFSQSTLKVSFDGTVMTSVALDSTNAPFSTNTCGASNNDLITVKIYGIMKHSSTSSLTLQIQHYLNKDSASASIGIRDLSMNFATVTTGIFTNLICGYAPGITFYSGKCVCPVGQYNTTTTGGCTTCDSSCGSCYGAGSNQCYTCATGFTFNGQQCMKCDSSCSVCYGTTYSSCTVCSPGYWLLNGTTCIPSCDYPLIQNVTGTQITCNSPCSTSQYLYWDGTCSSTCTSPLQNNTLWSTIPTCNWNCSSTTDYLYWNGTCDSNCNSPLTTVISHSRRFCTDTCAQYLYWNGTCNTCASPLTTRTEGGKNFCDYPCAAYQYLYWNGSCLNNCSSPYSSRLEGGYQFCDYPCAATGQFLYYNGSCFSSCTVPLTTRTEASRQYCDYSCEKTQYLYWNGTCGNTCTFPLSIRIDAGRQFCDYPCAATGQHLYWNGLCSSSCPSPLTTRSEASRLYCDYPCCTSQYLYWNGSCMNNCSSPLSITTTNSRQFCNYPCTTGQYLYWNGTCGTCASPLTQRTDLSGNLYCDYPCQTTQYLYWNGSCLNNCSFPLNTRTEASRMYCDYPCATTGQHLYWNGSCLTTCSSPLSPRTEASRQYCDYSCDISQYLYGNGTCSNNCNSPLTIRTEASRNYCDFGCTTGQYLYWNGSCKSTCNSPLTNYTISGNLYCDYPCYLDQYLYWNGSCINNCSSPLSQRTEANRLYCDYPCTTGQFLYWNGTCSSSCSSPLSQRIDSAGKKYCDYLCETTQYLYWNGTCSNDCSSPLTLRTEASRQYCDYSCLISSQYLYWNGSCLSTCSSPPFISTTINSKKYCYYPCSTTQYLYWNGTCSNDCDSPLTIRTEASRQYCDYPCATGQFLYWNGTCASSCSSPLTQRIDAAGKKYCDYLCETTQYLYWNGTCSNDCSPPLTMRTEASRQYCDYSCTTASQYLYWNGTCSSSCNFPLTTRTEGSKKFCDYSCCSSEYLYWNGTCASTCASPLTSRTEAGQQYCDFTCATSTNFLYWNGTCSSSCPSPLVSLTQGTVQSRKFCNSPCGSYNYLYTNGSCISTCPDPYYSLTVGGVKYCYSPCLTTEYLIWDGSCVTSCPSPMRTVTYNYGKACLGPCTTELEYYHTDTLTCDTTCGSVSSIILGIYLTCSPNGTVATPNKTVIVKNITENTVLVMGKTELVGMLRYLYFLDITYPPSLKLISISKGRNILSPRLSLEMSSSLSSKLPEVKLPGVFNSRDMKSNFFVNFWDEFVLTLIILVVAILFWIAQKTAEKRGFEKIRLACARMNILLKWNIFFVIFSTNMGNIILYAGLQLMNVDTSSGMGVFSLGLCCVFLALVVGFFAGNILLVKRRRTVKVTPLGVSKTTSSTSTEADESQAPTEFPSLQVLYRGFKDDIFGSYFYPIYTLRSVFPLILTLFFYQSPLAQILLQIPIGLVMIGLVVIKKPILSKLSHLELIIQETIVLVINFAAIGIIHMSNQGKSDSKIADFLGNIIVHGSQAINWTVIVFLAIRVTLEAQEIQKLRQTKYSNDKTVWIHLLCHFVQQGGFGFEKLTILNLPSSKTAPLKSQISVPKLFNNEEITLSTTNPLSVTIPTHAPTNKTAHEDEEAETPRIFGVDSEILTASENKARWRKATRDKNCASFLLRPDRPSFIASDANSSIIKGLPAGGRGSVLQTFANDSMTETPETPTRPRSNTAENLKIKLHNVEQTDSSRLFTPMEPGSATRLFTPMDSARSLLFAENENNYKGRVHRRSIFGGGGGDFGTRNHYQNDDEQSGEQTSRSLRNEINTKFEISSSPIFKRPRLSMKPDENKVGSLNWEGLDLTNKSLSVIEETGTPKIGLGPQLDTPKSEAPLTTEYSMHEV